MMYVVFCLYFETEGVSKWSDGFQAEWINKVWSDDFQTELIDQV